MLDLQEAQKKLIESIFEYSAALIKTNKLNIEIYPLQYTDILKLVLVGDIDTLPSYIFQKRKQSKEKHGLINLPIFKYHIHEQNEIKYSTPLISESDNKILILHIEMKKAKEIDLEKLKSILQNFGNNPATRVIKETLINLVQSLTKLAQESIISVQNLSPKSTAVPVPTGFFPEDTKKPTNDTEPLLSSQPSTSLRQESPTTDFFPECTKKPTNDTEPLLSSQPSTSKTKIGCNCTII